MLAVDRKCDYAMEQDEPNMLAGPPIDRVHLAGPPIDRVQLSKSKCKDYPKPRGEHVHEGFKNYVKIRCSAIDPTSNL